MPWTPKDAARHTKKAQSPKRKRQWSKTANSVLSRGGSEGSAVRIANAAVKKSSKTKRKAIKHRGKNFHMKG